MPVCIILTFYSVPQLRFEQSDLILPISTTFSDLTTAGTQQLMLTGSRKHHP